MKYKDLKDLKPGDKVVVEVANVDKSDFRWTVRIKGGDPTGFIANNAILGVEHEPAKIKMTEAEKKEFDKLLERHPGADLNGFLNAIWNNSGDYSDLGKRLFVNANLIVDRKNQFEFARALENSDLVEVEKPKKYYVHLFPGENGYLIYFKNDKRYVVDAKGMGGQPVFTKDEIEEINRKHSTFEIKPEALEGVEEDE